MGEYVDIAKERAAHYGIPAEIVCGICETESSWIPWAIRYEPGFYRKYIEPIIVPQTLTMTDAHARSQSWGLMQVMGQVAREMGFRGRFLSELCDPNTGIDYGCKKFVRCLAQSSGDVRAALLRYNGGGDAGYPDRVLANAAKYKAAE